MYRTFWSLNRDCVGQWSTEIKLLPVASLSGAASMCENLPRGNFNSATKMSQKIQNLWREFGAKYFLKNLLKNEFCYLKHSLSHSHYLVCSLSLSDGRLCHFVRFALHKSIGGLSYPRCPKLLQES